MNILIMGMNYAPEQTSVAPFTTGLSEFLVSRGHRVFAATTFPHVPGWVVQEPYRGKTFLRETKNGVRILRGYVYVPRKPKTVRRIVYDTSFAISAFLWGLCIHDIDVILAISPPVQVGLSAWALSVLKRTSFVFQIKDLAVDAAVAVGMLKKPAVIRLAQSLERLVYRKSRKILVLCQAFADNLKAKGVPESKIVIVPDWVDTTFVRPLERHNDFRHAQHVDPREFVVLHAGNMGAKQGLENVVQAAKQLGKGNSVLFLLVGDGSEKARLEAAATREGLTNVRFLPLQPRDVLPQMLSAADVLLINQRASVVDSVVPSKLLTYMAAGRPILAAVHPDSEASKYIREAECGLIIPPEEPRQLANAILRVRSSPDLATSFGCKARAFAEKHFGKEQVLQRYDEFFRKLQPC